MDGSAGICVGSLISFTSFFAIGVGPIPFVYMGEILPEAIKAPVGALGIAGNWLANIMVATGFPLVVNTLGMATAFAAFSAVNAIAVVFGFVLMEETKQRPVAEVHDLLLVL